MDALIVLSGGVSPEARLLARKMGAVKFVEKPCRTCGVPLVLAARSAAEESEWDPLCPAHAGGGMKLDLPGVGRHPPGPMRIREL